MSQAGILSDSTGPGQDIETLTGNSGGAVGPTGFNIDFTASGGFSIIGTPASSLLNMAPAGWTAGSVVFASAATAFSQDNANFFWDDSNDRLAIGNVAPLSSVGITGNLSVGATYGEIAAPASGAIIEGTVGIGTITPGGNLCIGAGSTLVDSSLKTQASAQGTVGYYAMNRSTGAYGALFGWDSTWGVTIRSVNVADSIIMVVNNTVAALTVMPTTFVGIGTVSPATQLETQENITLTGNVTDSYAAAITIDPGFTVTDGGNYTVTRLNYMDINQPSEAETSGTITITDGAVMRFDAAIGTHVCIDGASTKTTPSGVDAWVKININGAILYVPCYTSKTA